MDKKRQVSTHWSPRISLGDWLFVWCMILYFVLSLIVFWAVVNPSFYGKSHITVGADSQMYLWFAGVPGIPAPDGKLIGETAPTLLSLGGNFIGPLGIAYLLKNTSLIMIFNDCIFILSIFLLVKSTETRWPLLIGLLLVNPLTLLSLLTLNKEIISLLSISLLINYHSRVTRPKILLFVLLLVSVCARWEQCLLIVIYLVTTSENKIFRENRGLIIFGLVLAIGIAYPLIASGSQDKTIRGSDIQGGAIVLLNWLQMHYLYVLAFIPKSCLSMYGAILSPWSWINYDWDNLPNSSLLIWNSIANAALTVAIAHKLNKVGKLHLRNDMMYLASLCIVIMSVAPFTNMRYLYPIYIIFAYELSSSTNSVKHLSGYREKAYFADNAVRLKG